jgi:hypothetical protein
MEKSEKEFAEAIKIQLGGTREYLIDRLMDVPDVFSADVITRAPGQIEFIIDGGDPVKIAEVFYNHCPACVMTLGDIEAQFAGHHYRFSRPRDFKCQE